MSSKLQEFFEQPLAKSAEFSLSQSAAEPLTYQELLGLEANAESEVLSGSLDYARRHGSEPLIAAIAARYRDVESDCITITSGLDDALGMLFLSLVSPGDRVVVLTPSYPPHLLLPHSRGAEVVAWQSREDNDWVPSLHELEQLLSEKTRLVLVTFPQNPTGFMPDQDYVAELVALLARQQTILLSDEIYSGLPHESPVGVSQLCDHYEHAISMHGLSKTFGLPGLRVGWLASRDEALMATIRSHRELFNCYVPAPVDGLARLALRHEEALLARTSAIVSGNLSLATEFFARNDNLFRWQPPMAGVLSFPRWLGPGGTLALSERLLKDAALAFAPSACFDVGDDHLRLSVARSDFGGAIARLDEFLAENF